MGPAGQPEHVERFIEAGRAVATENLDAIRELLKEDTPTHENQIDNVVGERVA